MTSSHRQTLSGQESWIFGEEVDESIAWHYIGYRYRLLPYLESLFEESSRTGSPIMRPLIWIAPHDAMAHTIDDQFMLGNFLMIAPITRPKARHRLVYLPQGQWNDVWTGEQFTGPCHIVASAPLQDIPIYVRAGSIIPLGPSVMSTQSLDTAWQDGTDGPEGFLITRGYGEFVTYSDDGQTFAYQAGQSRRVKVTVRTDSEVTHIRITAEEWSSNVPPLSRPYRLWVGFFAEPPHAVKVHGQPVTWAWDDETGKVSLTLPDALTPTRPFTIHIEG